MSRNTPPKPPDAPPWQRQWSDWLHPMQAVRRRFTHWWQSKIAPLDALTLTQRNVYILPTGAGGMLGITLLVLLLASINYQLNLGYLLTFLLAGHVVVGVYVCHNTLLGLQMKLSVGSSVYAGERQYITIELINARRKPRLAIGLANYPRRVHVDWVYCDVPAQASTRVQLGFEVTQRGWHTIPTLTAETRYPIGTFRVWTIWRPASRVLVYPQPEARPPPLPQALSSDEEGLSAAQMARTGEMDGVREYQRGDSMRLIVWRKIAKSDHWVSRDQSTLRQSPLWLDWHHTPAPSIEEKISRLTAWVLLAEKNGRPYGLRLPSIEIAPAQGLAHAHRCLEALALC